MASNQSMRRLLHLALIVVLATTCAFAQARSKRLILKDGSYQPATKWEVKGDRVRYYSADRYMWEELPTSLVDWPATEQFEKDVSSGKVRGNDSAQDAADPSLDEPEPEPPTVAPGLQLPDTGGIYMLERYNQQPRLVEVVQNGSEINQQRAKNILRSVINPLPSGPSQTVELRGIKADVQSHTLTPEFFVNLNFDSTDDRSAEPLPSGFDRYRIIRLQTKPKDKVRIVSNLKISLLGKVKEQRDLVPTRSEPLDKHWIRIVPLQPLEPGEYALVEMVSEKQMNLYVWDFGVDPKAPPNRQAWAPKQLESTETGTTDNPFLNTRKKN